MSENDKNTKDINPEEMKLLWNQLNERITGIEEQLQLCSRKVIDKKLSSSKEQLTAIYRRLFIMGCFFAILFPSLILTHAMDYPDTVMRYYAAGAFAVFFITTAVMDCNQFNSISDMNLNTMSITEVAARARTLKRRHHIYQLILVPLAIVTLTLFTIPLASDRYTIYGIIFGGIVGMALGLRLYLKIMRGYKNLMNV